MWWRLWGLNRYAMSFEDRLCVGCFRFSGFGRDMSKCTIVCVMCMYVPSAKHVLRWKNHLSCSTNGEEKQISGQIVLL